jgi:threonine synthase
MAPAWGLNERTRLKFPASAIAVSVIEELILVSAIAVVVTVVVTVTGGLEKYNPKPVPATIRRITIDTARTVVETAFDPGLGNNLLSESR